MREVKPVKYKVWNFTANDEAVCPYCEHGNEIEVEDERDGEEFEIECGGCDRTFVYSCNFSVSFDTKPLENYYLEEREKLVQRLIHFENEPEIYKWQDEAALRTKDDIERLDKRIGKILEEETHEEETENSAGTRA